MIEQDKGVSRMMICGVCEKDIHTADSCIRYMIPIHGIEFDPIPYGDENDFVVQGTEQEENQKCPECHVQVGGIHHAGCDVSQCPHCGQKLATCDCVIDGGETEEIEFEERMQAIRKEHEKKMEEFGWVYHAVMVDAYHANYHTHGVLESFGHPDFQCVLPVDPKLVHELFVGLIENVKRGIRYDEEEGTRFDDVLTEFDVIFKKVPVEETNILRLIIPDEKGRFPFDEGCDPSFKAQWDEVDFEDPQDLALE